MHVLHTSTTALLALGVAAVLGGVSLLSSWQALLLPVEAQLRGGGPAAEPPLCWARGKELGPGLE